MVWMCPKEKCSYTEKIEAKGVCPQCGTKAKEYTSWLGEVNNLKNKKLRFQESLKPKPAVEKRAEDLSRTLPLPPPLPPPPREVELYKREKEIIKREREVLRRKEELSRLQQELSKRKPKKALFASVTTTMVGVILLIMGLYIANNLPKFLFTTSYTLMLTLVSVLPILGIGLIIVGTIGIIVTFILESKGG